MDKTLSILALCLTVIIALLGIRANVKLIILFGRNKNFSNFHGLTIALAAFDIMVIFCLILNGMFYEFLTDKDKPWQEGSRVLHREVIIPSTFVFGVASIYTTVAISLERFVLIYQIWEMDKVPLWKILATIVSFSVVYNLREFVAESVVFDGKLLGANPTYQLVNLIIHLLFTMLIPYAIMIYTNYMVIKELKQKSRFFKRQINDDSLATPLFKAKFSTYIVFLFIFCHSFKAIGVQGFYGLYAASKLGQHPLDPSPQREWVDAIDGLSWLLVVINCSAHYFVYKWVERKARRKEYELPMSQIITGSQRIFSTLLTDIKEEEEPTSEAKTESKSQFFLDVQVQ